MNEDYRESDTTCDLHEAVYHRVNDIACAVEQSAGGVDSSERHVEQAGKLQRLTAYLDDLRFVNEHSDDLIAERQEYPHDEQRESHRYKHAAVISAYNAILQTRSDVLTREGGNRRVHGGKWLLHELLDAHCRGVRRHDCFAEAVRGPL